MTAVDRWLQRWRQSNVGPYLRPGARLLDIGCSDGSLFRQFSGQFSRGIGIDPGLARTVEGPAYRLIAGSFPDDLQGETGFDVIGLFAVLEHVPLDQQSTLATNIAQRLTRGGHLVVTVPSPRVDAILEWLRALKLIHGMSLEQHYGFDADRTPAIFGAAGLALVKQQRFQLGLNNLFVFQKP